jgi:hypothetical protein
MRGRGLMGVPLLNVWRRQEQEGSSFVCVRTKRPTTRRETMKTTALEACGAHVTGILSLAVGHQERVRSLPFLCSLHLIETVDVSVVLFHDNTESTRHNHCGVT